VKEPSTVAERLADVRQRIEAASRRAGRDPAEVTLVGVSKRQSLEKIRAAIEAGLKSLGENQVQEAAAKIPLLPLGLDYHFLGTLQSNKVKTAVRFFDTIHSVDRLKIARLLERHAEEQDRRLRGFVQVHLGEESSKHGFPLEGLAEAIAPLAELRRLEIVGLMAIPPYEEEPERARAWFRRLRETRDLLAERGEWRGFPGCLSMGMSHDFELAVEEGATHVRVGTSIFGPREG
jgi:pyridoxal phosphate enzyme (YggS family)